MATVFDLTTPTQREILDRDAASAPRRIGQKEYRKILQGQHTSAGEVIRAVCWYCQGGYKDQELVAGDCGVLTCPIRLAGKYPYLKGSPEQSSNSMFESGCDQGGISTIQKKSSPRQTALCGGREYKHD